MPVSIRLWQSLRMAGKVRGNGNLEVTQQHGNKLADFMEVKIHSFKMVTNLTPEVPISAEIVV